MSASTASQDPTGEAVANLDKIREVLAAIDAAHSTYPACVSLTIPPGDSLYDIKQWLDEQITLAWKVPVRVHRLSAVGALTDAKQMLAVHKEIPENGLAVYCGELWDESRITIQFEPQRAIPGRNFHMDYKFNVDFLADMVAMDGMLVHQELNRLMDADDPSGQ